MNLFTFLTFFGAIYQIFVFKINGHFFVFFTTTYIFYLTERDALNISTINDDLDKLPGNPKPTRFL